jgi:hypothetical protein
MRLLELVGLSAMTPVFRTDESPRLVLMTHPGDEHPDITGLMFFHYPTKKYIFIEFLHVIFQKSTIGSICDWIVIYHNHVTLECTI